jgi:hypothetical protein
VPVHQLAIGKSFCSPNPRPLVGRPALAVYLLSTTLLPYNLARMLVSALPVPFLRRLHQTPPHRGWRSVHLTVFI